MSIKIQSQVWDHSGQREGRLLLLVALAETANDDGWAWPSVPTLARKVRMSDRYVQLMLKDIEDDGEISIHQGEGPGGVNRFHVHPGVYRILDDAEVVNHGSPLAESSPVIHDSPGGDPLITGGRTMDHRGVIPNSPKPSWNRHGTIQESPPPTPASGAGPFSDDWDFGEEAEASYEVLGAEDEYLDDLVAGGGGDEEEDWELPATVLAPMERAIPEESAAVAALRERLIGRGGGGWDAEGYESRVGDRVVVAPQSAPPPAPAADDISWSECEAGLRKLRVEYFAAIRACGLPYRAILKKARQLANGQAGPGAIVNWFKKPEHIEALRAELAKPITPTVAPEADAPAPPTGAELLKQPPTWCSVEAWGTCSPALRVKLHEARQEDGWLWMESRRNQDAINGRYRAAIIAVLQQSGITPAPPAEPAAAAPPSGAWRAA
jgi:hypothetical protein